MGFLKKLTQKIMLKSIKNIDMEISNKSQDLNGRDNIVSNQAADNNAPVIQNSQITTNNFGIDSQTLQLMFAMSEDKIKAEFDLKLENRMSKLRQEVNDKLSNNNIVLSNTVDPNIIAFYKKLHFQAACSSSDLDIDLLSELMVKRLEIKDNREDALAIEKTAEIINYVKEEELVALCIYFFMFYVDFNKSDSFENDFENLLKKIKETKGKCNLPTDRRWTENLGALNVIRIVDYHGVYRDNTFVVCLKHLTSKLTPKEIVEMSKDKDDGLFKEVEEFLKCLDRQILYITPVGNVLINVFLGIRLSESIDIKIPY